MSRRQSRVSIDIRQNDTLLEFETFKKKFLLANKHITKLNSTLSARIEELNAQISTLYVENLRLRASEIALTSQLKKEREKSKKILADTESATHALMKQLGFIRKSFGVPHGRSPTPESNPQPPRAKRPIPDPNVSPPPNRIARAPAIPVLVEDDEPNMSSPEDPDDAEHELSPSLPRKRKTKSRSSSSSRLPLPLSKSPPSPTVDVFQFDFDDKLGKTGKRRPTRRQSGLLASVSITAVSTDSLNRPPSPVPSSPIRDAMDKDEMAAPEPDEDEVEVILQTVTKRERTAKKVKDRARGIVTDALVEVSRPRERKKHHVSEEPEDVAVESKFKFKDVTNSQGSRPVLPLLDTGSDRGRHQTPDGGVPSSATSLTSMSTRNFLSTPATTPGLLSKPSSQLPTPRSSSPIALPSQTELEPSAGGRERRVRKSVNYAEPKLNTKMRKPDPVPPPASTAKRASSGSAQDDLQPISSRSSPSNTADADAEPLSTGTIKRKKSRVYVPPEDEDESEGTQADAEFGGLRTGTWSNVEGRRRSVHSSSTRRIEGDDLRRHSMAV